MLGCGDGAPGRPTDDAGPLLLPGCGLLPPMLIGSSGLPAVEGAGAAEVGVAAAPVLGPLLPILAPTTTQRQSSASSPPPPIRAHFSQPGRRFASTGCGATCPDVGGAGVPAVGVPQEGQNAAPSARAVPQLAQNLLKIDPS